MPSKFELMSRKKNSYKSDGVGKKMCKKKIPYPSPINNSVILTDLKTPPLGY